MHLAELETPTLVLDRVKLDRNLERMRQRVQRLGCALRPHVKTAKSIEVVRRALHGEAGPITVSTLKEAEYFFAEGVRDIVYAVGVAPVKIPHLLDLAQRGAALTVLTDNLAAVRALGAAAAQARQRIGVLIELDVDGHRAGVAPHSADLLTIAAGVANEPGLTLRGVLTHAGGSYGCDSTEAIARMAERERAGAVEAARRLRAAGHAAPVVSVGSTPTATFARDLTGVTEVRVGVYMFQDLVMAGLGVCAIEDIALSVLVSVIGHQPERGWIITDGGWMALSRDRGTLQQRVDQGYGLVCGLHGAPLADDLIVAMANQEHGVIARRDGGAIDVQRYPVGALLRILPNHACATAAQHTHYQVIDGPGGELQTTWSRCNGW